jgi:hypothetical protein
MYGHQPEADDLNVGVSPQVRRAAAALLRLWAALRHLRIGSIGVRLSIRFAI